MNTVRLIGALILISTFYPVWSAIAATNSISAGIPEVGSISVIGEEDVYEFTASAGAQITAYMSNADIMESWIGVYDPAGNEVATAANSTAAGLWGITLTNSGTYQILCRDEGGNDTGSYNLTYVEIPGTNLVDAGETNSIQPGIPVTGTISKQSDLDVYEFEAIAGDAITIIMSNADIMESWIGVYDPAGNEVATAANSTAAGLWGITLTNSGTYQILCRDEGGNDTGSYNLTYVEIPGTNLVDAGETNSIQPGIPVTGTISKQSDLDVYEFEAIAGDAITIIMSNADIMESWIGVYDPAGNEVATAANSTAAGLWGITLTNSGTYQILCRDEGGNDTGSYNLTYVEIPGTNLVDAGETNSIQPGIPVTGTISKQSDLDVYEFEAIAGDAITIIMSNADFMESWLGIYYPDGTLLQSDSGTSEATVGSGFLDQTGTYYVLARDSGGDDTGSYSILLSQTPGLPPSGSPPEYLQIFTYTNSIMVRWPTNAIDFELEYNDSSLTNLPSAWSNLPPPYTVIGGYYFVPNTPTNEVKFFRLSK